MAAIWLHMLVHLAKLPGASNMHRGAASSMECQTQCNANQLARTSFMHSCILVAFCKQAREAIVERQAEGKQLSTKTITSTKRTLLATQGQSVRSTSLGQRRRHRGEAMSQRPRNPNHVSLGGKWLWVASEHCWGERQQCFCFASRQSYSEKLI